MKKSLIVILSMFAFGVMAADLPTKPAPKAPVAVKKAEPKKKDLGDKKPTPKKKKAEAK
jgi:hypothetical protein